MQYCTLSLSLCQHLFLPSFPIFSFSFLSQFCYFSVFVSLQFTLSPLFSLHLYQFFFALNRKYFLFLSVLESPMHSVYIFFLSPLLFYVCFYLLSLQSLFSFVKSFPNIGFLSFCLSISSYSIFTQLSLHLCFLCLSSI